ncbi:Uncharacterized protein GBIM_11374 [Gryllus bimaculatus]|nr:Uncharacterized protein GBIM_11374 [Gryllus bimaculatus]
MRTAAGCARRRRLPTRLQPSAAEGEPPTPACPAAALLPAASSPLRPRPPAPPTAFSCRQQPIYQSAQPAVRTSVSATGAAAAGAGAGPERASEHDLPAAAAAAAAAASEGPRGLLKWKGVVFTPEAEQPPGANDFAAAAAADAAAKAAAAAAEAGEAKEPLVGQRLTVELSRGWNARLGFSLRAQGLRTVVSAVHADSVAARDGRLRAGDLLVEVNEESVEHMTTADIIDLLRKIRGTIAITVVRPPPPPPLPAPESQPA